MQIYPEKTDTVSQFWREKYEREARRNWDLFYKRHTDKFFKDRHYLHHEWGKFLTVSSHEGDGMTVMERHKGASSGDERETTEAQHKQGKGKVILEVGCGVGNTVFPLLEDNPEAFVYACDFSERAVNLLKAHESYDESRVHAFVKDITADDLLSNIPVNSVDIVTLVFVLSAISPEKMAAAIHNILKVLKHGGHILFRDYAAGDLAQERFMAKEQKISESFYVRGDGTRAYYFTEDSLKSLFESEGLICEEMKIHHREITNKARELVMNRRWIQAAFRLEANTKANPTLAADIAIPRALRTEADDSTASRAGSSDGQNSGISDDSQGTMVSTPSGSESMSNKEGWACSTPPVSSLGPKADGMSFTGADGGDMLEEGLAEDGTALRGKDMASQVSGNLNLLGPSCSLNPAKGCLECSDGSGVREAGSGLEDNFSPTLFAEPASYEVQEVDVLCERVRLKMLPAENQHTQPNTGLLIWHSAPALAMFLSVNPALIHDKAVLELGCGAAALSSFIASKYARRVVATDGDRETMALVNENVLMNQDGFPVAKIACQRLQWGNWDDVQSVKCQTLCGEEDGGRHFDVVLGSDVVYVAEAVPLLFKTARALLTDGDSWVADLSGANETQQRTLSAVDDGECVERTNKSPNSDAANAQQIALPVAQEDYPQGPFLLLCHVPRGVSEQFILSAACKSGFRNYKALSWEDAWQKSFDPSCLSDKAGAGFESSKGSDNALIRAPYPGDAGIEALPSCLRLLWFW